MWVQTIILTKYQWPDLRIFSWVHRLDNSFFFFSLSFYLFSNGIKRKIKLVLMFVFGFKWNVQLICTYYSIFSTVCMQLNGQYKENFFLKKNNLDSSLFNAKTFLSVKIVANHLHLIFLLVSQTDIGEWTVFSRATFK